MDKRMRTNLILAAVVAALGLFIWLAPEPEPATQTFPLFAAEENISTIEVFENGESRFALERGDTGWRLILPSLKESGVATDDFQVDAFIDSLREPAHSRYAVTEANLDELGLTEPHWTLRVDGVELALGDRAALGNNRYVRKGDYIYIVSDVLSYRLQREPLDYAGKRLLPEGAHIAGIELPSGQRIEKSGTEWKLTPDETVGADALQALADAWSGATAMRVSLAENPPQGDAVRIELQDGTTMQFAIQAQDTGLILTRAEPPLRYHLPLDAADEMLQLATPTDSSSPE